MSSAAPSSLGERSDNISSSTIDRRCGSPKAEWIDALLLRETRGNILSTTIASIIVDQCGSRQPQIVESARPIKLRARDARACRRLGDKEVTLIAMRATRVRYRENLPPQRVRGGMDAQRTGEHNRLYAEAHDGYGNWPLPGRCSSDPRPRGNGCGLSLWLRPRLLVQATELDGVPMGLSLRAQVRAQLRHWD